MQSLQHYLVPMKDFLGITLIKLGNTPITIWTIFYLALTLTLLFYGTGKLKTWVVERIFARSNVDIGVRQSTGSIIRYLFVIVGIVVLLQSAGIDLSALTVLAGAIGIGIGFGLQNIATNFVSGLIILFERPVKVGDRIEVGNVTGDVLKISPRATTVMTNDKIAIIVPNSDFVTDKVINWSYPNREVRFHIPVGVSYGSDPEVIRNLLLEVADAHPGVLKEPTPDVLFEEFGESSLKFDLCVWTRQYTTRPKTLHSDLNFAIHKKLQENGVEIPFPQQEIHIRSLSPEWKFRDSIPEDDTHTA